MLASGTFHTALRGHLYNIKHIVRICIVFGGLLVPDYPNIFWFTWGTGTLTILSALGIAIRKSLRNKDPETEEEAGIDEDNNNDDSPGPDYYDKDGDCEPTGVDFDSLDPDAKKAFIISHWGHIYPVTPETADFFNVTPPDSADTRRASNMVRGEGSDGIANSSHSNVGVTRIANTTQERVVVPRQRRGIEHLGNTSLGRMESSNTAEDELKSTAQDEREDESDATPQDRVSILRQLYRRDNLGSAGFDNIQSNYTDEPRSIAQDESKPNEVDNTLQERIVTPRQRRRNDNLGSPSIGRIESNYTDEPTSTAQGERKPDENINTPERVVVSRQLYGSDRLGSPGSSRMQSNYNDEPRSNTEAERKLDKTDNTPQEPVPIPTRLYSDDRVGIPRFGRVQSSYTNETRSNTQSQRKLDENDDSKRIERSLHISEVTTSASPTERELDKNDDSKRIERPPNTSKATTNANPTIRNEAMRRMLYGANARDITAPLTTITTSTDNDERKPEEINDSKRSERSPNIPKVTTSPSIAERAGPDVRTGVTRRMPYDVHAHDVTAPLTTFTTSTDDDERKDDEINNPKVVERSPNTLRVSTTAGLVDRAGVFEHTEVKSRALHDADAGDATAPSTTSTTSTDHDDQGDYAEDDELEELLGSVTKDANNASPLRLKQDGLRTRYSMRLPSSAAVPSPQRSEPRDELDLLPKPLRVRGNTKESDDPADELMSALDFFKHDNEDAKREEAERTSAAEASSDDPAQNDHKETRRSPFASMKRFTSAPFSKGAKGPSKQDTDGKATSPIITRFIPRSTSSTKPSDHESSIQNDPSTQSQLPSPPSAIYRATTLNASNELEFSAVPYDQGYTPIPGNEQTPTPTPPPKNPRRKPLLTPLDTQNANNYAGDPSESSRTVAGNGAALASRLADVVSEYRDTIPSGLENSITDHIRGHTGDENDQPSTPMPQSPSIPQGLSSRRLRRRSSSESNGSGIFSPSAKIKRERVTNASRQVKMIEQQHLKENYGVSSTKELIVQGQKKPSLRDRIFSRSNTNTPETSPTDVPTTPVRRRNISVGPTSPYSAPHRSLQLSSPASIGRGRGNSRVSGVRRASSDTSDSGVPSNRLKLEDEAAEKAADKKMAKEEHVAYQVKKLRQATNTERKLHSSSDPRPAHPSHGCSFDQENLLCTTCTDNCANCGAPCCAFKGATETAVKEKGTAGGISAATLARSIKRWASEGRDAPTFLGCTECSRWVCTDCVGLCPVFPCHDRLCAGCNPCGVWEPCGFHTAEDVALSERMKRGSF